MASKGVIFEIQGLPGFKLALEQAADEIRRRVSLAEEETALTIVERARASVSVDRGDLRKAIISTPRSGPLDLTWTVGISDDVFPLRTTPGTKANRVHERPFIYGAILERGDHGQSAKPFMRPAADAELPRFESRINLTGLLG